MSLTRRATGLGALALALTMAGGATTPLTAQDTLSAQEAPAAPDHDRLVQFARAHAQINDARDEFHGQIARVHDEEGRRRAREEVDARIAEILAAEQIEAAEYDDFILRISLDGDLRESFEAALAEVVDGNTD